ncbi:enoyl-CoA hydratase/isomerase family protein [Desulfatibacillum aliphaticivorans]|uniref:enoyl-CoA hydratase/isomerase family protein n=1 Tax=Desulfatibacillum aliphaticivorans TaxID=218208 RepID=UPI00041B262C|nr:enoyl-CoA hydratase-related protein [Desulfatibacillum aliphaticivorans]
MDSGDLLYRVENNVAWLTINREKNRNSINGAVIEGFFKYLDEAENDPEVRVVCVTAAGNRAFCAGADLASAMGGGVGKAQSGNQAYADLLKRIAGYPKPTVARVAGSCVAGGTGFMLACDIVIAANTAKFGTPEVNVGLFPLMIGALIFRNVPRKAAMEMILLGDKITAEKALEMGMLTRVVAPEDLDAEVDKVLSTLAKKSPIGMKIGKEAYYAVDSMDLESALDLLSGKLSDVAATEDAKEGITAFLEKREPKFTGK